MHTHPQNVATPCSFAEHRGHARPRPPTPAACIEHGDRDNTVEPTRKRRVGTVRSPHSFRTLRPPLIFPPSNVCRSSFTIAVPFLLAPTNTPKQRSFCRTPYPSHSSSSSSSSTDMLSRVLFDFPFAFPDALERPSPPPWLLSPSPRGALLLFFFDAPMPLCFRGGLFRAPRRPLPLLAPPSPRYSPGGAGDPARSPLCCSAT